MSTLAIYVRHSGSNVIDLRSAYSSDDGSGYAVTDPDNLLQGFGVTWVQDLVDSPFLHGKVEVHATKDVQSRQMTVLCHPAQDVAMDDNTPTAVQTLISDLVAAVSVPWELAFSVGEATYAYSCMRANVSWVMNRKALHGNAPEVQLSYYSSPVPLVGSI